MASASPAARGWLPLDDVSGPDVTSFLAGTLGARLLALILAPTVAVFLWFFVAYQTSPLKRYPGPFLAGTLFLVLMNRQNPPIDRITHHLSPRD